MFSLLTNTSGSIPESKQPPILTKDEVVALTSKLTYAIPGMYRTSKQKRAKKGNGNIATFPSPRQTANLLKVYDVVQSATFTAFASDTVVEYKGAINFALAQLNDFSSYQEIFDLYRIAMVEVTYRPRANINTSGTANYCGMLYSAVDLTDSTTIASTKLNEYPGVVKTEAWKEQVHTFVPSIAVAAYSGAFTSYMNVSAPWIETSSSSVQHYGVKHALTISPATFAYDVTARIHFQFKTVK